MSWLESNRSFALNRWAHKQVVTDETPPSRTGLQFKLTFVVFTIQRPYGWLSLWTKMCVTILPSLIFIPTFTMTFGRTNGCMWTRPVSAGVKLSLNRLPSIDIQLQPTITTRKFFIFFLWVHTHLIFDSVKCWSLIGDGKLSLAFAFIYGTWSETMMSEITNKYWSQIVAVCLKQLVIPISFKRTQIK